MYAITHLAIVVVNLLLPRVLMHLSTGGSAYHLLTGRCTPTTAMLDTWPARSLKPNIRLNLVYGICSSNQGSLPASAKQVVLRARCVTSTRCGVLVPLALNIDVSPAQTYCLRSWSRFSALRVAGLLAKGYIRSEEVIQRNVHSYTAAKAPSGV